MQKPKRANSRRVIDIDKITLSILEDWRALQRKDYKRLGLSYTKQHFPVSTRFDKYEEKMEFPRLASTNDTLTKFFKNHLELPKITVHGFRHTHASLLFEAGAAIKAVQVQLGHIKKSNDYGRLHACLRGSKRENHKIDT
ncbi:tyrosine-type recombinase/integrase [Virgibacillus kekensis]|uniref:Tyrosine-type recombinase/integrase n=1 Tax=Virgibacillus kekensis TaxID=202261 RepID=A0ABV9DHN7_9BACI